MSIRKLFDGVHSDKSADKAADHAETDCCACNEAANEHVLSEYYAAPPDAAKSLHDGTKALLAEHGGVLCIPSDATTLGFVPRNQTTITRTALSCSMKGACATSSRPAPG